MQWLVALSSYIQPLKAEESLHDLMIMRLAEPTDKKGQQQIRKIEKDLRKVAESIQEKADKPKMSKAQYIARMKSFGIQVGV